MLTVHQTLDFRYGIPILVGVPIFHPRRGVPHPDGALPGAPTLNPQ